MIRINAGSFFIEISCAKIHLITLLGPSFSDNQCKLGVDFKLRDAILAARLNVPSVVEFVRQGGVLKRRCCLCKIIFYEDGDNWSHVMWDCQDTKHIRRSLNITQAMETRSIRPQNDYVYRGHSLFVKGNDRIHLEFILHRLLTK